MSEAELLLLLSRLDGGRDLFVRVLDHLARGIVGVAGGQRPPPLAGYAYDAAGQVVKDPDEEVAAAVADVFAAFTASGSAFGVVAAFAARRFPGGRAGERSWGRLTYSRVLGLLHNPVYAGAYVFGRHRTDRK